MSGSKISASVAIVLSGLAFLLNAAEPPGFTQSVRPLLEASCFKCHNEKKHKGDVDFASIADDSSALKRRKVWRKAIASLAANEMPPDSEPPLSATDREKLVKWMERAADYLDCADAANRDPGPSLVRRLNRAEYNNTIRDLLGVEFDAGERVGMPEEGVVKGFDNLAIALTLPPALMDKYLAAADQVLAIVFSPVLTNTDLKLDGKSRKEAKAAYDALVSVKPGLRISEREAARQIAGKFLRRAYRRPVQGEEVERYLKVYERAKAGAVEQTGSLPHLTALRAMLKPALVSPHFLFRIEESTSAQKTGRVTDFQLATRLSYFLWSTMPDEELFQLAEEAKLHQPAVLQAQWQRMLASPKARALTEQFAAQWLQFNKVSIARPSTEFFPAFDDKLRRAMREETALFFDNLRREDRSVIELLDADYTFVNKDLAKHYGLSGVTNAEFVRVNLKPEDHRGGILGMGSVLALTSHTHRTSPTLRGKYILEVVFGTPPPPPPPDAGVLKEEKNKKDPKTFRDQIAQHASDAACASCHKRMDPLGFALDNYDAVGSWREATPENKLDVSGQLPSGDRFTGVGELKQIILRRQDEFVRNLIEQMLSYALGREITDTDECAVREIQATMKANGQRFSSLVVGIVNSYPFQQRRSGDADTASGSPEQASTVRP